MLVERLMVGIGGEIDAFNNITQVTQISVCTSPLKRWLERLTVGVGGEVDGWHWWRD